MNKLVLLLLHHNTETPEALSFIRKMTSEGISVSVLNDLPNEIDNTVLYLCDDQMLIRALESHSAAVIGCELSSPLSCQNVATDIWTLEAEYLKERYDFITERSHCYYTTEDFTFWSPDYATYAELFQLHTQEAYYLPESRKAYTAEDLRNHYATLRLHSQLDELLRPYCIRHKKSGRLLGNIALSECSERFDCACADCEVKDPGFNKSVSSRYTLDYYILPEYRGQGYAAKAIRQFLRQLVPTSSITVIAEVHKNNPASQGTLAKLRQDGFVVPMHSEGELLIYVLDELLSD